jgi:acyl-CoA-binding protein
MLEQDEIEKSFQDAIAIASKLKLKEIPLDVQLRLYAYYKQATIGVVKINNVTKDLDIRNSFKINAWLQISHLTAIEAKQHYIEIIASLQK